MENPESNSTILSNGMRLVNDGNLYLWSVDNRLIMSTEFKEKDGKGNAVVSFTHDSSDEELLTAINLAKAFSPLSIDEDEELPFALRFYDGCKRLGVEVNLHPNVETALYNNPLFKALKHVAKLVDPNRGLGVVPTHLLAEERLKQLMASQSAQPENNKSMTITKAIMKVLTLKYEDQGQPPEDDNCTIAFPQKKTEKDILYSDECIVKFPLNKTILQETLRKILSVLTKKYTIKKLIVDILTPFNINMVLSQLALLPKIDIFFSKTSMKIIKECRPDFLPKACVEPEPGEENSSERFFNILIASLMQAATDPSLSYSDIKAYLFLLGNQFKCNITNDSSYLSLDRKFFAKKLSEKNDLSEKEVIKSIDNLILRKRYFNEKKMGTGQNKQSYYYLAMQDNKPSLELK